MSGKTPKRRLNRVTPFNLDSFFVPVTVSVGAQAWCAFYSSFYYQFHSAFLSSRTVITGSPLFSLPPVLRFSLLLFRSPSLASRAFRASHGSIASQLQVVSFVTRFPPSHRRPSPHSGTHSLSFFFSSPRVFGSPGFCPVDTLDSIFCLAFLLRHRRQQPPLETKGIFSLFIGQPSADRQPIRHLHGRPLVLLDCLLICLFPDTRRPRRRHSLAQFRVWTHPCPVTQV